MENENEIKADPSEREREEGETHNSKRVCVLTQKGVTTFCWLVVKYIYDGWLA